MHSVFSDQAKEIRYSHMINLKDRLLDVKVANERLLVLSEQAAMIYKLYNGEKEQIFSRVGLTCFAFDGFSNHLFVGTTSGSITEQQIDRSIEYK